LTNARINERKDFALLGRAITPGWAGSERRLPQAPGVARSEGQHIINRALAKRQQLRSDPTQRIRMAVLQPLDRSDKVAP